MDDTTTILIVGALQDLIKRMQGDIEGFARLGNDTKLTHSAQVYFLRQETEYKEKIKEVQAFMKELWFKNARTQ